MHLTPSQGTFAIRPLPFALVFVGIFQIVSLQSWEEVLFLYAKLDNMELSHISQEIPIWRLYVCYLFYLIIRDTLHGL